MRDAIEMIVKSLVDDPEAVDVREVEQRNGATLIEVRVSPEDIGKIIGKQGRTAKSVRTILNAVASRTNRKVVLEIIEDK